MVKEKKTHMLYLFTVSLTPIRRADLVYVTRIADVYGLD